MGELTLLVIWKLLDVLITNRKKNNPTIFFSTGNSMGKKKELLKREKCFIKGDTFGQVIAVHTKQMVVYV